MIDHDRARELHATSLRALMENPPNTRRVLVAAGVRQLSAHERHDLRRSAAWIDAVVSAWERGER